MYKIKINHNDYDVDIITDKNSVVSATVNGELIEIELIKAPSTSQTMSPSIVKKIPDNISKKQKTPKGKSIKAPIPGLILKINAKIGDSITKGSPLLVMEAMKMENIIQAECDGIVSDIPIKIGQIVQLDQLLITLE